jgi:hypothetical protein
VIQLEAEQVHIEREGAIEVLDEEHRVVECSELQRTPPPVLRRLGFGLG